MSYIHAAKRGTLKALFQTWEMQHPLKDMLNFLVSGRQLDRVLALRIVSDWQARTDAAEYMAANKAFESAMSNGDVKVRATGTGRILDVELSENMQQQPKELKNEFIISAVSQCMNKGREMIQSETLKANNAALERLYEELGRNRVSIDSEKGERSGLDMLFEDPTFLPAMALMFMERGDYVQQRFDIDKETKESVQALYSMEDM